MITPTTTGTLAVIGFEMAEGQALINGLRNTGLAVHPHFGEIVRLRDRRGVQRWINGPLRRAAALPAGPA